MKIVIGADSAGKPLLDVIAAHLKTKPEVELTDLSQSGYYADLSAKVGNAIVEGEHDRGILFCGTGIGVYQAAKDQGKLAIGVDSNQNHLQPGTMLSSMMKRVDVAVHAAAMAVRNGTWKPGTQVLGLKEQGVALAMDANNARLVSADMKKRLDAVEADIVAGRIKVATYTAEGGCKY